MTISPLNSKVLMLGAGFVTKPTLDILSDAGIKVTVGTYFCCICAKPPFNSFLPPAFHQHQEPFQLVTS